MTMDRSRFLTVLLFLLLVLNAQTRPGFAAPAANAAGVPVLLYHRFGPVAADAMTVTTAVFRQQLAWLRDHDCRIVPLREVVGNLRDGAMPRQWRAVAISVDDGHASVYTELFPLIRRYRFPVTLFIYPSAISNASYALTWPQIAEMAATGLVDVQSHTYWHPNFHTEAARLNAAEYQAFAAAQLARSKKVLEDKTGRPVDMLAWPFGIHDPDLERWARQAGYVAAFTLRRAPLEGDADMMALPRYLITDQDRDRRFAAIVEGQGADCSRAK